LPYSSYVGGHPKTNLRCNLIEKLKINPFIVAMENGRLDLIRIKKMKG